MLERIRKAHKESEGFTLIELLIVIVILGILAAIVVFAVGSTRGDAVSASCRTDVKAMQLSLEALNTKQGSYPLTANKDDMLASANKGGVLKTYSTNENYTLAYTASSPGSTYNIQVAAANASGIAGGPISPTSSDTDIKTACSKP